MIRKGGLIALGTYDWTVSVRMILVELSRVSEFASSTSNHPSLRLLIEPEHRSINLLLPLLLRLDRTKEIGTLKQALGILKVSMTRTLTNVGRLSIDIGLLGKGPRRAIPTVVSEHRLTTHKCTDRDLSADMVVLPSF